MKEKIVDYKKIFELKKELAELQRANPRMATMQAKIDDVLLRVGPNKYNRMIILQEMMLESFRNLTFELNEMTNKIKDLAKTNTKFIPKKTKNLYI